MNLGEILVPFFLPCHVGALTSKTEGHFFFVLSELTKVTGRSIIATCQVSVHISSHQL